MEAIGKLAAALAKAQGEIRGAKKDAENPFFKSNYADLASVWEACRDALSKNELAVVQTTELHEGSILLRTTLLHSSGESISGVLPVLVGEKATSQQLGSAITYNRRYALAAMVGVAPEDDDGNAAQATEGKAKFAKVVAPKIDEQKDLWLKFIAQVDNCDSQAKLTAMLSKNGPHLLKLKAERADLYDMVMAEVGAVQEAFMMADQSQAAE